MAPKIGDRLSYDSVICTVRYIGEVAGTSGSWIGVEWDDASRGKHDGSHKGKRYFTCKSKSPTAASFVRPTRPAETPQSFVAALREKYTSEISAASAQIRFSGKVAEEVGFDKIRRKQAVLSDLRFAILDGTRIAHVYAQDGDEGRIADTCPRVMELELSRNLFTALGAVVDICSELPLLRSLRLNGNRFQDIFEDQRLRDGHSSFKDVRDLALEETLMTWEEICHVATRFPVLTTLSADANQLTLLPSTLLSTLSSTLVSLNLEFNEFTALADVVALSELKSLRNLHLKGNNISAITNNISDPPPVFSQSLQYLDISYNKITSWSFIDDLPSSFPGLTSLRFSHNPIYDNPDPEHSLQTKNITEEVYMMAVGRLTNLKSLNFGSISKDDRMNAEMFYLARIGKHLSAVPPGQEAEVLKNHKRYAELCEMYGPPVINRKKEINPAFLEARLVTVQFTFRRRCPKGEDNDGNVVEKTSRIPKSFDIYRVKGIVGKLFGQEPLDLRLIWETGEWDPVAGFDDEIEDSSDEEEEGNDYKERDAADAAEAELDMGDATVSQADRKVGKWVKREVELQDGPRQLGLCVDGSEAKIRVEMR